MRKLSLGLVLMITAVSFADDAAVRAALDKPISIALERKTLPEAFLELADKSGVGISMGPEYLAMLPNGAETRLTLTIRERPLREGLEKMLDPISMTFRVADGRIEVVPKDGAVQRGVRRRNWNELKTLEWLDKTQWDGSRAVTDRLDKHLQYRVIDARAREKLRESMNRGNAGSVEDVLTIACDIHGWTWFADNTEIVIEDKLKHGLTKRVWIRANKLPLADVVRQIEQQSTVPIRFKPGTLDALPKRVREEFSVIIRNATVREALDIITQTTGLDYQIRKTDVLILVPGVARETPRVVDTPPVDPNDPVVAEIFLPDGGGRVLIRKSQLDAETEAMIVNLARKLAEKAGDRE